MASLGSSYTPAAPAPAAIDFGTNDRKTSVDLSVIIVNWRSVHHIRRCLPTIDSFIVDRSVEVIITDGASGDDCQDVVQREFPSAIFVQSPTNDGFGSANNLGFAQARGTFLLLLNPDTELRPGFAQLIESLEELPDAGIVAPRLLNTDGTMQTSCVQAFPTPLNQALDSDWLRRIWPRSSLWRTADAFGARLPVPVDSVSGACMLMKADTFRQVGGFSPEFFMYGEDIDLCVKVANLGLKIYHVPSVEVTHHGGGSSGGAFARQSAIHMRHAVYKLIRKHRGSIPAETYRIFMMLTAAARILPLSCGYLGMRLMRRGSPAVHTSLQKWISILRWSLGLETAVTRR